MAGNTNSLGFAVDHDGHCLEDTISDNVAPFAISGAVFAELFAGSGKDCSNTHLDVHPVESSGVSIPSSSGGIPFVDAVTIEDYVSSDEEPPSPRSAIEICKNNTSATVHAMMRTSKHEREELLRARRKLGDVLSFLKKQGFSEEMVIKDLEAEGFSSGSPCRDEFGLPTLAKLVGSTEAKNGEIGAEGPVMKNKVVVEDPKLAHVVFDGKQSSDPFKDKMKGKVDSFTGNAEVHKMEHVGNVGAGAEKPSWSSVVTKNSPVEELVFDYHPLPSGASVVTPPSDVLKKGLEKFKLCLVGVFSKGTLPFSKMVECARKAWDAKGLCHVSQKNSHTFLFTFRSEMEMHSVLARGTWYFERKPLLLHS